MCSPSSSEVPAAVVDEAAGLGVWRACLSTPSETHNQQTLKQLQPDVPNPSELWTPQKKKDKIWTPSASHQERTKSGHHVRPTKDNLKRSSQHCWQRQYVNKGTFKRTCSGRSANNCLSCLEHPRQQLGLNHCHRLPGDEQRGTDVIRKVRQTLPSAEPRTS